MKIDATLVCPSGLRHIAANLRPRDRREIFALRWNDDVDEFAFEVGKVAGDLWRMWWVDGEPVAVAGVVPIRPGVVIGGAFGTDKWRQVVRPMTRWFRDYTIPILNRSNYHRGEVYVLAENTDGRRWVEFLGAEIEAVLKGYGRGREDFLLYVWRPYAEGSDGHVLWRRRRQRPEWPANANYGCH